MLTIPNIETVHTPHLSTLDPYSNVTVFAAIRPDSTHEGPWHGGISEEHVTELQQDSCMCVRVCSLLHQRFDCRTADLLLLLYRSPVVRLSFRFTSSQLPKPVLVVCKGGLRA